MANEISTAFVKQFASIIEILSQQKGSKLRNLVRLKTGIVGEDAYIDQIGTSTARSKTTRNSDVEYSNSDYYRRRLSMETIYDAKLLDKEDKVKMLADPTSPETLNIAYALGRGIDDKIITKAFAIAYTGKDGTSETSFPSGKVVAVDASGLTLAKLLEAKRLLDNANVDDDEPRNIAITGTQLMDLLGVEEIKSAEYDTVKALVQGKINTFCGFNFVRISTSLLDTDSNDYRRVICWAQNGLALGIAKDMQNRIDVIPGKHYATQVYSSMDLGATRLDEDKVIEIKCRED